MHGAWLLIARIRELLLENIWDNWLDSDDIFETRIVWWERFWWDCEFLRALYKRFQVVLSPMIHENQDFASLSQNAQLLYMYFHLNTGKTVSPVSLFEITSEFKESLKELREFISRTSNSHALWHVRWRWYMYGRIAEVREFENQEPIIIKAKKTPYIYPELWDTHRWSWRKSNRRINVVNDLFNKWGNPRRVLDFFTENQWREFTISQLEKQFIDMSPSEIKLLIWKINTKITEAWMKWEIELNSGNCYVYNIR